MATLGTAPTSVQLSHSLMIPGENILLSWSGAIAGTDNPIMGYLVQFRDNTSADWEEFCTVLTDLTSYMTTVSLPLTRGGYRYWRVTTLGINDSTATGTRGYSTIVNCKVNRLPFAPVVSTNKTEIPYNGTSEDKTVTFTITADVTADDIGETQIFSYSTSLGGAKTAIVNGGSVTINATTTFYLWSYDGLEYCSSPTQKLVTKNSLPSITNLLSVPSFSSIGPDSKVLTTKVTMTPVASSALSHSLKAYYRFEYSATLDFASPILGDYIEGSILPASNLITSTINNGKYFKVRVKVVDQTFTTDYSELLDTIIYYMPKMPDAYVNNIVLKPINEKTGAPMSDYTLSGVNYYRRWFQYGCSSFAANNGNGYGTIALVRIYFNNNSNISTTATITTGTVAETLINHTVFSEETALSTISAQLLVRDEFGQEQVLTTTSVSKDLTKLTDVLTVTGAVTYTGTPIAGKTGLAVYDIDNFNLSFANLKAHYPNSFNYSDFDPTVISTYQKLTFLAANHIIHSDDYIATVDGSLTTTITIKTRSTFGVGATTGLLNSTTKLINSATNDSNFVIHIYDHFGIIHQLQLSAPTNIDFRATPKVVNSTNGLVNIATAGWTNPFLATNEYYGAYKDQVLTLKFNTLVFGDQNIVNGGSDSIKARIYIYESGNLIKTISTTWDCNSTLSTYNLTLSEFNLGAFTTTKTIEVKVAAYDNTGLESSAASRYSIGTFVIFIKNIPTIALTQLVYDTDVLDDIINASYTYTYDVVNNRYVSGFETVYGAKNVTLVLDGYSPLEGTLEVISLMAGIIPASGVTPIDQLVFTLNNGVSKQTITPKLVVTITYHDNTTKTIISNTKKLKFGEPTMSLRKNRVSFNKEFEDIDVSIGDDGVLYVHSESDTITKMYLTHSYNEVTHTIVINLATSEIDGAVIDGGAY